MAEKFEYDYGVDSKGKAHVWSNSYHLTSLCGVPIAFHFTSEELYGVVKCRICKSSAVKAAPGPIICIEGFMGQGLTMLAVALAIEESKRTGRTIVSNIKLNWPNYKPFNVLKADKVFNSLILIDNAEFFFDSRRSSSKQNCLLSYMLSLSRKRANKVYLTTHNLNLLDKRVRISMEQRIRVAKYPKDIFKFRSVDLRTGTTTNGTINGSSYFNYYNTLEIPKGL